MPDRESVMSDLVFLDPGFTAGERRVETVRKSVHNRLGWASGYFKSASLRFALLYVVVFAVSAIAISVSLWYSAVAVLDNQAYQTIDNKAQDLAEIYNRGGLTVLSLAIKKRVGENADDHALYLLVDANGDRIAGNIDLWPTDISKPYTWYRLPLKRYEIVMQAIYKYYPLAKGYKLLIGRDTRTTQRLRAVLYQGLLVAGCAMIMLGLLGGLIVRSLFRRAMTNLGEVSAAIGKGDLAYRVKLRSTNDEFNQLAKTINSILDMVQALIQNVRQVTDGVAHDLRTPITRARIRLEDAVSSKVVAHLSKDDFIETIHGAVDDLDKVQKIFSSLLRISEIESGERRAGFSHIHFSGVMDNVREFYEAAAEEQNIKISGFWSRSLYFYGDRQMLEQSVVNLVENALKFTPPSSTITIGAFILEGHLLVSVADQGPGIPAEDREKATRRFYRADEARCTPGSGLGLALVSAVADLHHGKLRLEDNAPGLKAILDMPCTRNA